jgi:hypothetical protein
VTVIVPERPPVAVGVKVTLSEQVPSEATDPPQLVTGTVTTAKSPEATTEVTVSVPEPVLVRMIDRTVLVVDNVWSPKLSDVGLKLTIGVAATPVPFTVTVYGEAFALLNTSSMAVRAPPAVGVNVTLNVQLVPDNISDGQLSVKLKSPAFAPLSILLLLVTVPPAPEVFVKVNDCEADDVPTV